MFDITTINQAINQDGTLNDSRDHRMNYTEIRKPPEKSDAEGKCLRNKVAPFLSFS